MELALVSFAEEIGKLNDSMVPFPVILNVYWLRVSTPNSVYYACVVYHPDESLYDQEDLLDFLTTTCEHLMSADPNCKIIIAGDVNQLKYKDLLVHASLSQMVKKPIRGKNISDVFITNTPYL